MAQQTITWITLPNGFVDRDGSLRARLSVFVSPQLRPDDPPVLEPFDFADWPAHCTPDKLGFDVVFAGTQTAAEIVSMPESSTWRALFNDQTFVRPYAPDATSGVFGTYPSAPLHNDLKRAYQAIASASPVIEPSEAEVMEALSNLESLFVGEPLIEIATDGMDDHEQRIRVAEGLFRSDARAAELRWADELVDIALREAERRRDADGRSPFVPIVPDTGSAANRFAQLAVFLQQPRGTTRPANGAAPDRRIDFHQQLTALAEYRDLQRRLGLVIDIDIDANAVPEAEANAPALVRVEPRFLAAPNHATVPVMPPTAYICERGRIFAAANSDAANPEWANGLLNLRRKTADGDNEFSIGQADVDGAALKLLQLVGGMTRSRRGAASQSSLASLRTAGISVMRRDNAERLHAAISDGLGRMSEARRGADPLFADNLVRGFRVDVRKGEVAWLSLHERIGTYTLGGVTEDDPVRDEGYAQTTTVQPLPVSGAASSTHDSTAPDYLSESMFLWGGWSLSVPRPGESLPQPSDAQDPEPGEAREMLNLNVSLNIPDRSLPRLRFGERYDIRIRMVDLAGNGPTLDDANAVLAGHGDAATLPMLPAAGESFTFRRFEPVTAPIPVVRARPHLGETSDRIILRSTFDMAPDDYVLAHPEARNANERHIAPPKTYQLMAEMHGLFDASIGDGTDFAGTYALARRESGSLIDGALPSPETEAGEPPANPVHPEIDLRITYLPDPLAAGVAFQNLPGMPPQTVGRATDNGIEFENLNLGGDRATDVQSVLLVGWGDGARWPDLQPLRLVLAEGAGPPEWDATARALTVQLPKGVSSVVRMSCSLREQDLDKLGLWAWLRERANAPGEADEAELRRLAQLGLCWLLTPHQELTLVHAVPQPVDQPVLQDASPMFRLHGSTFSYVRLRGHVHSPSSGRIDLVGSWPELIDDAVSPEVVRVDREAQIFGSALPLAGIMAAPPSEATIAFDASTGIVTFLGPQIERFQVDIDGALSNFGAAIQGFRTVLLSQPGTTWDSLAGNAADLRDELFGLARSPMFWPAAEALARNVGFSDMLSPQGDPLPPHLPEAPPEVLTAASAVDGEAAVLADAIKGGLDELNAYLGVRHEFGDTKYRAVTYKAVVTTRYGDCFADDGTANTREGMLTAVQVLSTAPPPPPTIQYLVPSFRWTKPVPSFPNDYRSERRGGGLRIYLGRPWYASGADEMLAVLTRGEFDSGVPFDRLEPFVSHWGRDPLWRAKPLPQILRAEHFRNFAVERAVSLHKDDLTRGFGRIDRVGVVAVAYPVTIAEGRCFCDIELDPRQSYFPFVRLAIARLQPNSLSGVALSRVAVADFMQIAPDRAVAVVKENADQYSVTVTGTTHQSHADPFNLDGQVGTRVSLRVQQRIPGTSDEAGWERSDAAQVLVATDTPFEDVLWQGNVALPSERNQGQFRLLIEERELLKGAESRESTPLEIPVSRVVFAETVEV